jgi:hypothetical protein
MEHRPAYRAATLDVDYEVRKWLRENGLTELPRYRGPGLPVAPRRVRTMEECMAINERLRREIEEEEIEALLRE